MALSMTACGNKGEKLTLYAETWEGDNVRLAVDFYYPEDADITLEGDEEYPNWMDMHYTSKNITISPAIFEDTTFDNNKEYDKENEETYTEFKLNGYDCYAYEGFGGYWLPEEMTLTACRGGKDHSFTEIVVHHGVNPENSRYAYALLPGRTEKETAAFDQHPDVRILANTAEVQAAAFENGPRMYIFWRAGEFDGIRVSAPAAVMLEGDTLLISDPTQKTDRIEVQIAAKTYVFDTAGTFGKTLRCRI